MNQHHDRILTRDPQINRNYLLRKTISRGTNYREPKTIHKDNMIIRINNLT